MLHVILCLLSAAEPTPEQVIRYRDAAIQYKAEKIARMEKQLAKDKAMRGPKKGGKKSENARRLDEHERELAAAIKKLKAAKLSELTVAIDEFDRRAEVGEIGGLSTPVKVEAVINESMFVALIGDRGPEQVGKNTVVFKSGQEVLIAGAPTAKAAVGDIVDVSMYVFDAAEKHPAYDDLPQLKVLDRDAMVAALRELEQENEPKDEKPKKRRQRFLTP